ncbi:MAG TPA: glycosyltransferase family 1 protein [Anaerolineales bacterium]|nr:glycosyltransferase family 1 protein [Anaerolineales bacterium]
MPHIALSALLMDGRASYRSAGIHQYIYNALTTLAAEPEDFTYTAFTRPGAARIAGLRNVAAPVGGRLRRIAWEQLSQPGAIARLQPKVDLVHGLAFSLPLLSRLPAVVTVYDLSFLRLPDRFPTTQRLYLSAITRLSCRHARRVIAISEATRRDVAERLGVPAARIDLAYPGVDARFKRLPTAEVESFRARQGLPARFVLYLGTLEPRKNLPTLVQAFAQARRIQPDLHLVLAGARGWWYHSLLRMISDLNLGDRIHLPGFVPADDLPLWYNAAAAFAYPSTFEGFGLPVAEALACGTPTVTSDSSSLPESGGAVAARIPVEDVDALTRALLAALSPDEAERTRTAGPAHAARFTWNATAAAFRASYRAALVSEQAA